MTPEKIPRLEKQTGKPALELARLVVQEDVAELENKASLEKKKHRNQGLPGVAGGIKEIHRPWRQGSGSA